MLVKGESLEKLGVRLQENVGPQLPALGKSACVHAYAPLTGTQSLGKGDFTASFVNQKFQTLPTGRDLDWTQCQTSSYSLEYCGNTSVSPRNRGDGMRTPARPRPNQSALRKSRTICVRGFFLFLTFPICVSNQYTDCVIYDCSYRAMRKCVSVSVSERVVCRCMCMCRVGVCGVCRLRAHLCL